MTEQGLMSAIKTSWGPAIDAACKTSSLPPAFLAALIANESGGDKNATRFEPAVLGAFWSLLLGRTANYGSLRRDDVLAFLSTPAATAEVSALGKLPGIVTVTMLRLDGLATSQGLTQIMGYEALAFKLPDVAALEDPAVSLPLTVKMLAQFAERFALNLASDFENLFDCWNTGRPHAKTFDPEYVPRGLTRLRLYQSLAASN